MKVLAILTALAAAELYSAPKKEKFSETSASLLDNLVENYNLGCFKESCSTAMQECVGNDKNCEKRLGCLTKAGHSADGAKTCFEGLHLLDMDHHELKVLGCAQESGCLKMRKHAMSFLDITSKDTLAKASSSFLEESSTEEYHHRRASEDHKSFQDLVHQADDEDSSHKHTHHNNLVPNYNIPTHFKETRGEKLAWRAAEKEQDEIKELTRHLKQKYNELHDKRSGISQADRDKFDQEPGNKDDDDSDDDASLLQTAVDANGNLRQH